MYDFAIRFEQDTAPGLAVFCRDLPELNSYGDDEVHALADAVDAIETTLSIYVDQRRAIPAASAPEPGEHVIRLPAVTVAKIALWNTMIERNMRKADLCRLLGVHQAQGDRLVDFLHTSKMEQVEAALAAMGKHLTVSLSQTQRTYFQATRALTKDALGNDIFTGLSVAESQRFNYLSESFLNHEKRTSQDEDEYLALLDKHRIGMSEQLSAEIESQYRFDNRR